MCFYLTGKILICAQVHAANMKESSENMYVILEEIKYEKYNLNICGYLKVIAVLLGKVLFLSVWVG